MTTTDPKPITLIVTIYPPKKNTRRVVISGAPEGEMPLMLDGLFPERHALLDRVFAMVLKRAPQLVTLKADKPGKSKSVTAGADAEEEPGNREPDEAADATQSAASDQLVSADTDAESVPVSSIIGTTSNEELPAIEGDIEASGQSHVTVLDLEAEVNDGE
jgi:hypothetical protein